MNHFIISMEDNELKHVQKLTEDEFIASRERYRELKNTEKRYKEHLNSLTTHTLVADTRLEQLHKIESEYNETRYEYCKLKVRYMQEQLFQYHGDSIDWAVYSITRFLNDYLKEKGVDENTSLTEKRMYTIGFAHRVEEGLLDYLEKLEEFNS